MRSPLKTMAACVGWVLLSSGLRWTLDTNEDGALTQAEMKAGHAKMLRPSPAP